MSNQIKKLKTYLSDGLLLAKILEDSAKFALRRATHRSRNQKINVILVDLDGTLINSNSPLDAIALKQGKQKANKIFEKILNDFKSGKANFDQTVFNTNLAVEKTGISKSDWLMLLKSYLKKGKISIHLLTALKIAKRKKIKIIIATRSSLKFAKIVSDFFGFDGAIGTNISKRKTGCLIGSKNGTFHGIRIYTKLGKLSSMLSKHKNFTPNKVAIITNDAMDSQELVSSGLGILLTHHNKPNSIELAARKLELYDLLIKEESGLEKKFLSVFK